MRPAKIAAIVGGVLLVLIGLGLVLPGGFILWAHGTQRDSEGFYETSSRALSTSTYALTTPNVDLQFDPWTWVPEGGSATVRLRAEVTDQTPLFIGIGPSDLVSEYLVGVAHDEVASLGGWFDAIDYRHVGGGAPSSTPGQQDFWVAKQEGTGILTLEWPVQGGNWTAVLMNADGSARVTSVVSLGARFNILLPIGAGLAGAGFVFLAIGIVLIVLGARRPRRASTQGPTYPVEPPAQARVDSNPATEPSPGRQIVNEQATPYPPSTGSANPPTSSYPLTFSVDYPDKPLNRLTSFFRFLWIIPIGIIAALIGTGTISGQGWGYSWSWAIGGFLFIPVLLMILFRKKYPRWWFDWNLNVTRFLMRVSVYAQLLRDEYPSTDEEQAVHVDFPYPDAQQLSRGLPLVKWFLAIPHWIVLYFLWIAAAVCIIIAWFAILFTARYPRSLFDFVVGVNRWTLRVDAYAILLITDAYPPFSLSE